MRGPVAVLKLDLDATNLPRQNRGNPKCGSASAVLAWAGTSIKITILPVVLHRIPARQRAIGKTALVARVPERGCMLRGINHLAIPILHCRPRTPQSEVPPERDSMQALIRPFGPLHVQATGPEGATAVVFANSLGTDLRLWDRVLPLLLQGLRRIRYDKRGHGLSALGGGRVIDDHADDAIAPPAFAAGAG